MLLHEQLRSFVGQYGTAPLVSPYVMGFLHDGHIFRGFELRKYRDVFHEMISQGLLTKIVNMKSWNPTDINAIEQALTAQYKGKASIEYTVESVGYALGLVNTMQHSRIAGAAVDADKQVYDLESPTVPYLAHGSGKSIGTLIPTGMALNIHRHLKDIEDENGSVTNYLLDELQEPSAESLESKLSSEQMDGVALAIRQLKNGSGFILGDMTGIGKGRQMAMLIHWACIQGLRPVYVTEKSILFRDIFRDLQDVGHGDLRPFILNSGRDAVVEDEDGNVIYGLPTDDDLDIFKNTGTLPPGYDFLLLTYSQLSREKSKNWKVGAVGKFVENNYLLLDESHNTTGSDSNTGEFFREAVAKAIGVCFSSATYAKYPSSMSIYALKTAMGDSGIEAKDLIDIITKGGPILQEVMAKGLVASGNMIRRQRDMSGVEYSLYTCEDTQRNDLLKERYDSLMHIISDIRDFQQEYIKPYLERINPENIIKTNHKLSVNEKFVKDSAKVTYAKFSTLMTPAIRQLLFTIKTFDAIDLTIKEIKAGRKPIVQLARTMESGLKRILGDKTALTNADFALVLLDYLDSMFKYRVEATTTRKAGKQTHIQTYSDPCEFTLDDIRNATNNPRAPQDAYDTLVNTIKNADTGLPLSPVDYFIQSVEEAGYTVGELTQRSSALHYDDITKPNGKATLIKRKKGNKKKLADYFNSGNIDVLIGNRVMSSGISLHSSASFSDQRQRVVITWEQQDSADVQMQFNGRADRTGQIMHCAFTVLSSVIPAEQRFLMMNNRKQLSLNANVEALQHSDNICTDIINKYGAHVVMEYIKNNPERAMLFPDLCIDDEKYTIYKKFKKGGASTIMTANKMVVYVNDFMRMLCLLDCHDQEVILQEVIEQYHDYINYLNDTGENDLITTAKPLEATLLKRETFCKGKSRSKSTFAMDANLDKMEINVLRKPLTAGQIAELMPSFIDETAVAKMIDDYCQMRTISIANYYSQLRNNALNQIAAINSSAPGSYRPSRIKELEARANNTSKMQEQQGNVANLGNELKSLLKLFKIGQAVGIPSLLTNQGLTWQDPSIINQCVSVGMFLGYKVNSANVMPSTIKAVFAVNDSRRMIQIPLSAPEKLQCIKAQSCYGSMLGRLSQVNLSSWDTLATRNTRETSYIVTGNIILGMAHARKVALKIGDNNIRALVAAMNTGHLITFTDINGKVHTGYQLSPFYDPDIIKRYV